MKRSAAILLAVLPALLAAGAASSAEPQPREVAGTIAGFECGDNCYLRVKAGKDEITGLCEAAACRPWLEEGAMPARFVGKRVRAELGTGVQRDGSGAEMGRFPAFTRIEFPGEKR